MSKLITPRAHSADSSDSLLPARMSSRQRRRFIEWRRRRERRGIILIFVVILLMLLAIMGTAYLASSRADRTPITRTTANQGTVAPRVLDRTRLDGLFEASQRRVENAIIEDLFNVAPGKLPKLAYDADHGSNSAKARLFASFRQDQQPSIAGTGAGSDAHIYYHNYDAPGRADPYLASLLPTLPVAGGAVRWPWISAPLSGEIMPGVSTAPFFADPRGIDANNSFNNTTSQGFRIPPYATQVDPTSADPAVDPTTPAGQLAWRNQVNQRFRLGINAIQMTRADASANNLTLESSMTTRVYPGFALTSGGFAIAGDADGDGIADCGLMPVILNNNASNYVDRYVDAANGVVYFVGYRVVDNSAQINMNTALTAKGDYESNFVTGTGATSIRTLLETTAPDAPNLGFFRSNIGLTELVKNSLESYAGSPTPLVAEMDRLSDTRFPQLKTTSTAEAAPASGTEYALRRLSFAKDPNGSAGTKFVGRYYLGPRDNAVTLTSGTAQPQEDWYYRFRSLGDLLEQQVARQTGAPGQVRTGLGVVAQGGLVSLPTADTLSFAAAGGTLLNPQLTPSDGEKALLLSTNMFAPNFTASTDAPWRWFPPGESATWFGWTKDFGLLNTGGPLTAAPAGTAYTVDLLDNATASARKYTFPARSGMASIDVSKPIRSLLTTHSGVTNVTPKRYDSYINGAGLLPAGMPAYGAATDDQENYPAQRVSASTGTKEQLWRAYWSVMTQNTVLAGSGSAGYTTELDLFDGRTTPMGTSSVTHYFPYAAPEVTADPYRKAYDAFLPPDRHPDLAPYATDIPAGSSRPQIRLNDKQMTLVRSAIAACNTIDLRDNDNDITAMTVDLGESQEYAGPSPGPDGIFGTGDDIPAKTHSTGTRQEMYARVYGTEKQLAITGVMVDRHGGTDFTFVEIFNPSNEPLRLDGYYIGVADRSATANATAQLDSGIVTIDPAGPPVTADTTIDNRAHLLPATAVGTNTIAPGGFLILCSGDPTTPFTGVSVHAAIPKDLTVATKKGSSVELTATSPPPQVIYYPNMTGLNQALQPDRELVLYRTRRADGVAYTENANVETESNTTDLGRKRRPRMSEVVPPAAPDDLAKMVPVDAVDFRTITAAAVSGGGPPAAGPSAPAADGRYWYLRSTTHPNYYTPNKYAWREFYAGKFFDQRPGKGVETFDGVNGTITTAPTAIVRPQPSVRPASLPEWAWREYPAATGETFTAKLGEYREPDPAGSTPNNEPGIGGVGVAPTPFYAPTIPIQNATPYTVFDTSQFLQPMAYANPVVDPYSPSTAYAAGGGGAGPYVDHPPFQYPYGSPFARNADILNVPYIGSYTIYRVQITGAPSIGSTMSQITFNPTPQVYDFVPLPMDAVNVAPFSAQWRRVAGSTADGVVENGSVGRFDPRLTILPRNDWAADLFDYVVARQADDSKVNFPDVPRVKASLAANYNDPLVPLTDQDGPVVGYAVAPIPNDRKDTSWAEWRSDGTNGVARTGAGSFSREPNTVSNGLTDTGSKLTEGTINLNTAPPVVLRMLPWTVDPTTGLLDQTFGTPSNIEQRWRVGVIDDFLTNPTTAVTALATPGRQHADLNDPPYGITSVFALSDLRRLKMADPADTTSTRLTTDKITLDVSDPFPVVPSTLTNDVSMMRLGMLNPMFRSASTSDFGLQHLNANRVSNLATQRSDVFTVYVTVQAWSYVANGPPSNATAVQKQFYGTRLVGERRGSFVVDRSRISPDNYKPSDLIIYPVEQE